MKEKLTNRISRIITGTANSIVDAIEGAVPETVMEQAIRDVDTVIADVREELGRVEANKHLLMKSITDKSSAQYDAYTLRTVHSRPDSFGSRLAATASVWS
jgi:phage shock protein A